MSIHEISAMVSVAVALVMIMSGMAHLYRPEGLFDAYPKRAFAQIPNSVRGSVRILAAIFLLIPEIRIWGGMLAAFIEFGAVVTLLRDSRYAWAIPGIIVTMATPVTMIPTLQP
jgi:hypothetical protein